MTKSQKWRENKKQQNKTDPSLLVYVVSTGEISMKIKYKNNSTEMSHPQRANTYAWTKAGATVSLSQGARMERADHTVIFGA